MPKIARLGFRDTPPSNQASLFKSTILQQITRYHTVYAVACLIYFPMGAHIHKNTYNSVCSGVVELFSHGGTSIRILYHTAHSGVHELFSHRGTTYRYKWFHNCYTVIFQEINDIHLSNKKMFIGRFRHRLLEKCLECQTFLIIQSEVRLKFGLCSGTCTAVHNRRIKSENFWIHLTNSNSH